MYYAVIIATYTFIINCFFKELQSHIYTLPAMAINTSCTGGTQKGLYTLVTNKTVKQMAAKRESNVQEGRTVPADELRGSWQQELIS